MWQRSSTWLVLCVLLCALSAQAAPVVFEVGGDTTTSSIQPTVDAFRAALGSPNNLNAPGPLASGRREINWDGGGGVDISTAPVTPFNVFLNLRGAQFTTPGAGLTQAPPAGGPQGGLAGLFSNATYGTTFSTFSPLRLFAPANSNIVDATFFIPGSNGTAPAAVSGFGAVFTDVDLPDSTQIEYFDPTGVLLLRQFVSAGSVQDGSLSFLGVLFDAGEQIARVRITSGNTPLGPNDDPSNGIDVVALDDFLYSEPQHVVPEPSTLALCGLGIVALCGFRRLRPRV
ncbi:MAG: PEP-CTERM sorting domain-containing protein [Candidatus Tectimicrobiota bacterium]